MNSEDTSETNQPDKYGRNRNGFVYFLQVENDGFVKIGFTAGVPALRAKALQQGSPYLLRWIGQYSAVAEEERIVHQHFDAYRLRNEWFFPVRPVMDFIREKSPDFNPDREVESLFRTDVLDDYRRLNTQGNHLASALFLHHMQQLGSQFRYDFSKWLSMTQIPSAGLVTATITAIKAVREDLASGKRQLSRGNSGWLVPVNEAAA